MGRGWGWGGGWVGFLFRRKGLSGEREGEQLCEERGGRERVKERESGGREREKEEERGRERGGQMER